MRTHGKFVRAVATYVWLASLWAGSGVSSADIAATPSWGVTVAGIPSVLPSGIGHRGKFIIIVENNGSIGSSGGAEVRDQLPVGLTPTSALGGECAGGNAGEIVCTLPEPLAAGGLAAIYIGFEETGALTRGSLLQNKVTVVGGGGAEVAGEASIRVQANGEKIPGPPGIAHFAVNATGPSGGPAMQAGGHPNLLTTSVLFNTLYAEGLRDPVQPIEAVKDLVFYLPLGMLGDPAVAEQCPIASVGLAAEVEGCPPGSRVGTILPMVLSTNFASQRGIYNIKPEKGYVAEFAFTSNNFTFITYANVVYRNKKYMVRVAIPGVPVGSNLTGFVASLYGDLEEHYLRGENELVFDRGAFLTNPSDCSEDEQSREAEIAANTWEHPDTALSIDSSSLVFPSLMGCERLAFSTRLGVKPETTQVDEASGVEVDLEVPQAPNDPSGFGTPPVRDVVLTLPKGMTVSASSANGLQACAEVGPEGINIDGSESQEVAADGLERPAPGHCPAASQIGIVKASTPLLHEELVGRIFLAKPGCGGEGQLACSVGDAEDGNLIGLYLELEGPNSGVVIKLKGHATLRQGAGQVTASFEELPQFPFSKVIALTKYGPHAPLANPQACGEATSRVVLTPWSPGVDTASADDSFTVDRNGGGLRCPETPPFEPSFAAGTTRPGAALTSPFTLTLERADGEQDVGTVSTTLPEGLLADTAKVTRCLEPQASENSLTACPASSQIGTTTVAVGSGSDPYYEQGKVFFTGPYAGAPFGLSVVVPAAAGPFNLGDVHVRVKLMIDPHTAQATAVSDPLPQELDGIPLRMRTLNVHLTDGDFVLNPTSCAKTSITGAVTSPTGTTAAVSSPFAAEGCNKLLFNPTFNASTEAKATKAEGTGVRVKIAYPSSGEANVAKVVVGFPKQLPVRLETLQKACPAATFEANPAACPAASNVGTAIAHTPILAAPLTGPVYLVSYGNAKFPDAVFVLQGEGITIDVDGQSFVSKSGALKVTFASVPDAPFSTFETVLPRGPHSQFTSVKTSGKEQGSQCGQNLFIPVSMVAHNGAQLNKNVHMQIAGCPPSVAILKTKASAHTLVVTVRTTDKGTLRLGGSGLQTLTKRKLGAGTHKFSLALTSAGKAAARAHRRTQLRAKLTVGKRRASARREIAL